MASLGEDQASQPLKKEDGWTTNQLHLLGSAQLGVLGIVMGTFFYGALMPSLEADMGLSWSTSDTTRMATFASAATTLGLFTAGPMADYLQPRMLLGINALVVCIGLALFSTLTANYQFIAIVCTLTFARGVMWSSSTVVLSANLPPRKHDPAFIFTALGSRIGDVIGPVVISVSVATLGLSWRVSMRLLLLFVALAFTISWSVVPGYLREPETREALSFQGLSRKMYRLVTDVDGWLVFITDVGTYGVWSLYDYTAVMTAETYNLSPGNAASATAYISLGSAVGLVVAFLSSSIIGVNGGRAVHLIQSAMSIVALCLLAMNKVPLYAAYTLLFVVGFGFVAMAYVPFMIYASRARADERAFRAAMVDGLSQLCSVGFSYTYGTLRADLGEEGVSMIYLIAAGCMVASTLALATFYRRLSTQEEGELADKAADAEEPAS